MAEIIITPDDLDCFDNYVETHPIALDLVYADANHPENVFDAQIYKSDAKIWAHKDMLRLTLMAAEDLYQKHKLILQVKDCLRVTEAQQKIIDTPIVQAHPEWITPPNTMLATAGQGGHPRGMAVDVALLTEDGDLVDMGTPFDFFPMDKNDVNPSARDFAHDARVMENRKILDDAMMGAAATCDLPLWPLPQEWWDFRFEPDYAYQYAPLSDDDLPAHMKMMP